MTEFHPSGSALPIQPWFLESMRRQLVHEKEGARRYGEFQQHLVQRFGAWRVFPVKAGRWVREPFWHELTDDLPSLLLAPVLLPLRSARWKPVSERLQLLDPSSGMPIAEHTVVRLGLGSDGERAQWRQTRQLALLGDPRVGGLIAPLHADSLGQVLTVNRSGYYFGANVAEYEQKAAQLVNLPYRDFTERNDGPWVADQPEKPKGHTNGWKPSPWYRPA